MLLKGAYCVGEHFVALQSSNTYVLSLRPVITMIMSKFDKILLVLVIKLMYC